MIAVVSAAPPPAKAGAAKARRLFGMAQGPSTAVRSAETGQPATVAICKGAL